MKGSFPNSVAIMELLTTFRHQNGVLERKNRTLEDMARTMMCESNAPQSFWAEAVNTANYILNRCLIRPILKRTPYELFKGHRPNAVSYTHLTLPTKRIV